VAVEQLRPRQGQEQDRSVAQTTDQPRNEREQGFVAPLHVLEDEDRRLFGNERLDEASGRRQQLGSLDLGFGALSDDRREVTGEFLVVATREVPYRFGQLCARGLGIVGDVNVGNRSDDVSERTAGTFPVGKGTSPVRAGSG
jgi:hypothetical protein